MNEPSLKLFPERRREMYAAFPDSGAFATAAAQIALTVEQARSVAKLVGEDRMKNWSSGHRERTGEIEAALLADHGGAGALAQMSLTVDEAKLVKTMIDSEYASIEEVAKVTEAMDDSNSVVQTVEPANGTEAAEKPAVTSENVEAHSATPTEPPATEPAVTSDSLAERNGATGESKAEAIWNADAELRAEFLDSLGAFLADYRRHPDEYSDAAPAVSKPTATNVRSNVPTKPSVTAQTEETTDPKAKAIWNADAELRAEFAGSFAAFLGDWTHNPDEYSEAAAGNISDRTEANSAGVLDADVEAQASALWRSDANLRSEFAQFSVFLALYRKCPEEFEVLTAATV